MTAGTSDVPAAEEAAMLVAQAGADYLHPVDFEERLIARLEEAADAGAEDGAAPAGAGG